MELSFNDHSFRMHKMNLWCRKSPKSQAFVIGGFGVPDLAHWGVVSKDNMRVTADVSMWCLLGND